MICPNCSYNEEGNTPFVGIFALGIKFLTTDKYAIAYSDKNGKDFCEKYPWLLDDFSSEYEAKERADWLIKEGYKNVIPFRF